MLKTGYVVIGDHQRIKGYSLLLCEECKTELHFLESAFRDKFLHEMSVVAEAVYNAFKSEKLDYELLGAGKGLHMHWHIFPRRTGDAPKPGPVWQLGNELHDEKYLPNEAELEDLRNRLNAELDSIIHKGYSVK
ncbi:MAG: HIT family protein [Lachnospiraceae bacterium]|nr:HIT family protein [Lachnospiraceae bacterium]